MVSPPAPRVEVSVPARPEDLAILRLVIRRVCTSNGADVDEVDDAALAVQEAGIALIDAGGPDPSRRLTMEAMPTAAGTQVRLTVSAAAAVPPESMSLSIIEALASELEVSNSGGTASIRMVLCADS